MKVELVAIYEQSIDGVKRHYSGSAHVYLVDYDIDIRGVCVSIRSGKPWIALPTYMGWNKEKQTMIKFSIMQFADMQKTADLRESISACIMKHITEKVLIEGCTDLRYTVYPEKECKAKPNFKKKPKPKPKPKPNANATKKPFNKNFSKNTKIQAKNPFKKPDEKKGNSAIFASDPVRPATYQSISDLQKSRKKY